MARPPRRKRKTPTSIRLPDAILEWCQAQADKIGVSRMAFITMVLKSRMDFETSNAAKK